MTRDQDKAERQMTIIIRLVNATEKLHQAQEQLDAARAEYREEFGIDISLKKMPKPSPKPLPE